MTIPASYTETREFNYSKTALSDTVSKALQSLEWEFALVNPEFFKGKIRRSIWSWGENFEIHIEENGSIRMQSKCRLATSIVDWGKNKRNVKKFFLAFEKVSN